MTSFMVVQSFSNFNNAFLQKLTSPTDETFDEDIKKRLLGDTNEFVSLHDELNHPEYKKDRSKELLEDIFRTVKGVQIDGGFYLGMRDVYNELGIKNVDPDFNSVCDYCASLSQQGSEMIKMPSICAQQFIEQFSVQKERER